MEIKVEKSASVKIAELRQLFLQERKFQFIYNKCHLYGWADVYEIAVNNKVAGYASLMDGKEKGVRNNVFEFYLTRPFQYEANKIFNELCIACNAKYVECQSNDDLLSQMLYEHAHTIHAEAILFEDSKQTDYTIQHAVLQKVDTDNTNDCHYILLHNNKEVAKGGFMLNYNFPYADIYYEVNENFRNKGFGTYFTQELKKEVYKMERVPAARCNINNGFSKRLLLKAGFAICGYVLVGYLNNEKK